jgi:dethiobiotin synthetase
MAVQPKPAGQGLFVAGTDTGVGKTLVAAALVHAYAARGLRALGMKPVAAGCAERGGRLVNEDATALVAASNVAASEDDINPYRFRPAIAPHLAAALAGQRISLERIGAAYAALCRSADRVVVEGAGGLLVPLNDDQDFADLVRLLDLPVVLVVGMRLGCLNHALLTAEVLRYRGLRFAGWVANCLQPEMTAFSGNLQSLQKRLQVPLLGVLPYGSADPGVAARILDLPAGRH